MNSVRFLSAFILISVITVFLAFFSSNQYLRVSAQGKMRIVEERSEPFPNQPIEVVGKELGDKPFIGSKGVPGDHDWLKQLTLSVKNISNKNIMSFNIDLLIKKEGKIVMGIPIYFRTYTNPEDTNSMTVQGEKKLGYLLPGEIVKVKVSDQVITGFAGALRKNEVEDVDRVTLDIRAVYFDDLSRWMYGQESKPDSNSTQKQIRYDRSPPTLSTHFKELLSYFVPIDSEYPYYSFMSIFAGLQPAFFVTPKNRITSPSNPLLVFGMSRHS